MTKIWRIANGDVLAVAGSANQAQALKRWYEAGAEPEQYPKFQQDADMNSQLVVMTRDGLLGCYGSTPYPVREEGRLFTAFGSGRDFAIAAMALGKTAVEAVRVASRFDVSTGEGVDFFGLDGSSGHLR